MSYQAATLVLMSVKLIHLLYESSISVAGWFGVVSNDITTTLSCNAVKIGVVLF